VSTEIGSLLASFLQLQLPVALVAANIVSPLLAYLANLKYFEVFVDTGRDSKLLCTHGVPHMRFINCHSMDRYIDALGGKTQLKAKANAAGGCCSELVVVLANIV
jgi:hypothetical protein